MKKKHEKYNKWLGDDNYDASLVDLPLAGSALLRQSQAPADKDIPSRMRLSIRDTPGFFLGFPSGGGYVGIPMGAEGNMMVVGGNGSGKSAGIASPTLRTWTGAVCATDVKGELSDFYAKLHHCGLAARPYIIFDPAKIDGPSYDPFWLLAHDGADNLFNNVKEIAIAIAPALPDDKHPFWAETEQGVLTAALLHYFKCGLSFSETICKIVSITISKLCEELSESQDIQVRMALGEIGSLKPETRACFDRGLRNKLTAFATDPYIGHAFRGQREGATASPWDDLDCCNIFLRIPADKIEQWSGAINLMYTQLIRHLERRPEMHSPEGAGNIQTLLLMDEFARFGKLEMITSAMATLDDVVLLTPYGFCHAKKYRPDDEEMNSMLLSLPEMIQAAAIPVTPSETTSSRAIPCKIVRIPVYHDSFKKNEGAKIMSIEERTSNANRRVAAAEQKKMQEERVAQEAQRRKDNRRNYIIGELVTRYFPSLREYDPGTDAENQTHFEPLEAFLYALSTDYDLVEKLQERVAQLMAEDPDGEWRLPM